MAAYYAVVKSGFIQVDARNGQTEIYEDKESAARSKCVNCEVKKVGVLEAASLDEKAREILFLKDRLRFLKPFIEYSKDQMILPDGFSKMVDKKFWDLI